MYTWKKENKTFRS